MPNPFVKRPRFLFITAADPEHVRGGGGAAARSIIRLLRALPIEAVVSLEVLWERRPSLPHAGQQLMALLRSAVSPLSSKALFHSPLGGFGRAMDAIRPEDWDLIVINGGELFFLAEQLPAGIPTLGIAHNVESHLFAEITRKYSQLPIIGGFFHRDQVKFEAEERRGIRALSHLLTLSTEDEATFRNWLPTLSSITVPTCFEYPRFEKPPPDLYGRPIRLGFLAKMTWQPNIDSVEWLLTKVWPRLPPRMYELHLFGQNSHRFAGRAEGLLVHGFAEDISDVWETSDIMICPTVSGSGINIKFIESIYNRMPVLATRFSARGLPPLCDPAIIYRDGADAWVEFLSSGELARELATARPAELIADIFSVEGYACHLKRFLERSLIFQTEEKLGQAVDG